MSESYTVEVTYEWRVTYSIRASDDRAAESLGRELAQDDFAEEFEGAPCRSEFDVVLL